MEANAELQAILKKWGSEDAAQEFLRREFEQINSKAFEGCLSLPNFVIKPMWLSKGLMGERNSGADYEPAEANHPAEIGMFTAVLLDEGLTRLALVHEMIHHWESTIAGDNESAEYPTAMDELISKHFSESLCERRWRLTHSRRFISKTCRVGQALNFPLDKLLFGN